MARTHRSCAEIAAILERYDESHLSVARFADRNRLNRSTLQWWLKLRRAERRAEPSALVPVAIAGRPSGDPVSAMAPGL